MRKVVKELYFVDWRLLCVMEGEILAVWENRLLVKLIFAKGKCEPVFVFQIIPFST